MEGHGYRIHVEGSGKEVNLELHVLARAYHDACLALTLRTPAGRHRLEDLGVTLEYEHPVKR